MIFGTDGIRAEAGSPPLDAQTIRKLSGVLRSEFGPGVRVVCGRDTRRSGAQIHSWICHAWDGWELVDLGVVPTPVVAYETKARNAQLGVMLTASHNPAQYNGLKFFDGNGLKITRTVARRWSDQVEQMTSVPSPAAPHSIPAYPDAYRSMVTTHFGAEDFSGLTMAFDCANGACIHVAKQIAQDLKLDALFLGDAPDGTNINGHVGSLFPQAVARCVRDHDRHMGCALDGDGDRLVVVDAHGDVVHGDVLLYALSLCFEQEGLHLADVVGTILCGYGLERALDRRGMTLHRTPVGDQNVLATMQANGYLLGGEPSGHLIQGDLFPAGDGVLAALRLAKHLSRNPKLFQQAREQVPILPAYENAYVVRSKRPLNEVEPIKECVHALKQGLAGNGRLVLRYSGTEPKLRLWVESDQLSDVMGRIEQLERAIREVLS